MNPTKDNIVKDELINDKLINDKLINDKLINDKLINDKLIKDELINDKLINDKLIKDKLIKEYAFIYKETKKPLNKKELKLLYRKKQFDFLKSRAPHPDLVNIEDIKSDDPILFNKLKGLYKSVPVFKRWKSKFLFPLNYKKKEYNIPSSIIDTGLDLLRYNLIQEKKTETDKEKFMNKIFPKIGKVGLNPEKLYKSFTNTTYSLFEYGEAFDFSWETEKKRFVPGILTPELRAALGMTEFSPFPWIFKMQKIGPPAFDILIPGVNAEIPPGCFYGYEPNHWGKPLFMPKEKEEYIYNLENQYTALKEKLEENTNKNDTKDDTNKDYIIEDYIIEDDIKDNNIKDNNIKDNNIKDDDIKEDDIIDNNIEDNTIKKFNYSIKVENKKPQKKKNSKLRSKF